MQRCIKVYMKSLKFSLLFLALLCVCNVLHAQFRIAAHGSYINGTTNTKFRDVGLGVSLERSIIFDKMTFGLGLNYYFPTTINEDIYVYKKNAVEDSVKVNLQHQTFMVNIPARLKLFLKGNTEDDLNIYVIAGAGLWVAPNKSSMSSYDTSVYNAKYSAEIDKKTLTRISIDAGLGIERKLGARVFLFGEILGDFTATKTRVRTSNADFDLPNNLIINAGLRVNI